MFVSCDRIGDLHEFGQCECCDGRSFEKVSDVV